MNRREFSEPVKREIRQRSGGLCECHRMPPDIAFMFPKECGRTATQIDHVYADVLEEDDAKLEPLTAEDGAHLSDACHLLKTADDQKKRAKRNHHAIRKDRPSSGWFPKRETKWPSPKLQGRGFNKTLRKKMDGTVERRDA